MPGDNTTLLTVGIAAVVGLVLVLLLGGTEAPTPPSGVDQVVPEATVTETDRLPINVPPIAVAGPDMRVDQRERIRLQAEGYDPSGGPVSCHWTVDGGRGFLDNAYALQPVYTVPSLCGCDACIVLTLTVANERGMRATDQMRLFVRGDPIACPATTPCGVCATPFSPCAKPCDLCKKPCPSPDPCALEPAPCDAPCVTHIPSFRPVEPPAVPCRCCPPCYEPACGESARALWPAVTPACYPGPRPNPRIDPHCPRAVLEGSAVHLQGSIGNASLNPACFTWSADQGWFENENTLTPIWHAPSTDRTAGELVCIKLQVHDGCGRRGYDQILIRVHYDWSEGAG